jgi:hypothetical protein
MVTTDINHIRKISKKSNLLRPYDEWVALFSQAATNPPEFVKLIHTTFPDNITIDWTYKNPGDYTMVLNYYNNLVDDNSLMEISCDLDCDIGNSGIVSNYYQLGISISSVFASSSNYTDGQLYFAVNGLGTTEEVNGFFKLTIKRYYQ